MKWRRIIRSAAAFFLYSLLFQLFLIQLFVFLLFTGSTILILLLFINYYYFFTLFYIILLLLHKRKKHRDNMRKQALRKHHEKVFGGFGKKSKLKDLQGRQISSVRTEKSAKRQISVVLTK